MPTSYRISHCDRCPWEPERYASRKEAFRAVVARIKQDLRRVGHGHRTLYYPPDGYVGRQRDARRPIADGKCSVIYPGRVDAPGKPYVYCYPKQVLRRRKTRR